MTEAPSRWRLGRWIVVAGALCLVLQYLGAFQASDRWVLGTVGQVRAAPERSMLPLIVELDDRIFERWGEPPWSLELWVELAEALQASRIDSAYLVEHPGRLVALGELSAPRGARIEVPTTLISVPGGGVRAYGLTTAQPPLHPWDFQVHLPSHDDGVIRDLGEAALAGGQYGTSAFCAWTSHCPSGGEMALPLHNTSRGGMIPSVSAADLLEGHVRLAPEDVSQRVVLIGVTAPTRARLVHVGPNATRMAWPVAVGWAIASAQATRPALTLSAVWTALFLSLCLVVSSLAYRALASALGTIYLLLAPSAIWLVSLSAYFYGFFAPPLTALGVVALIPPMVVLLGNRAAFGSFLDKVSRIVLQEGFRHSPRASLIRSREELLVKLGGLTRSYMSTELCAYFHYDHGTSQLEFVGGYGITEGDIRTHQPSLRRAPWSSALRRQVAGEVFDDFFVDPMLQVRLVPLFVEKTLVGFWCIPFQLDQGPPDPRTVTELVRWLTPRLALPELPRSAADPGPLTLDRMESELSTMRDLLAAASEERRQQLETIRALTLPMLVADVSGAVLYVNRALQEVFEANDLGPVVSIRELLFRLKGEEQLGQLTARVCTGRENLILDWQSPNGSTFQVRLQPISAEDAGGHAPVLGYVAMFQDVTRSEKLKRLRAGVLQHTTAAIRNQLRTVHVLGSSALGARDLRTIRQHLRGILSEIDLIEAALEELQSVIGMEEEMNRELPSNLGEIVRMSIAGSEEFGKRRHVAFELTDPGAARPVLLIPGAAQAALTRLFQDVVRRVPEGERVLVELSESPNESHIEVRWAGSGLDEQTLTLLNSHESMSAADLPAGLGALVTVKEVFPQVHVRRTPGMGVSVRMSIPRA